MKDYKYHVKMPPSYYGGERPSAWLEDVVGSENFYWPGGNNILFKREEDAIMFRLKFDHD